MSGDAGSPTRYDTPTILLHWLTALLVVGLFALAEIWDALPRTPARKLLQSLHVSFGLLFAAVLVARIVWRLTAGGVCRGRPAASGDWPARACMSCSMC